MYVLGVIIKEDVYKILAYLWKQGKLASVMSLLRAVQCQSNYLKLTVIAKLLFTSE